jgi:hypothetical protein
MSKPALVSRIAVCVNLRRSRTSEPTLTAERWFLSGCYRKAEKQLAAGSRYYTLVLPAGWKIARQFGPLDLYSETGKFPARPGESSLAVMDLNEVAADFKAFVKAKNLKRNHYTALKELESTFLKIDGLEANLSHVSTIEVDGRKPVILQYCYISAGKTTILISGDRTDTLTKEAFESVCKSWKIKVPDRPGKP